MMDWTVPALSFGASAIGAGYLLWPRPVMDGPAVCELAGLKWTQEQFCHNTLFTGAIGSGKTRGVFAMLDAIFRSVPGFGGIFVDSKGDAHLHLLRLAKKHGRANDVVLIEVPYHGKYYYPAQRLNLLTATDTEIIMEILADLAIQGESQGKHSGFFRQQTAEHISGGIKFLQYCKRPVTFRNLEDFLTSTDRMKFDLDRLRKRQPGDATEKWIRHWELDYLGQPPDQFGGVTTSIGNALSPFVTNDYVAEVFSSEGPDTVCFDDINKGKIFCVLCPESYPKQKKAVQHVFKSLFFHEGSKRYDERKWKPASEHNLLIGFMDEYQRYALPEDSDFLDHLRDANCAIIAAMQDPISLIPPVGKDVAKVMLGKFLNRFWFTCESWESAEAAADAIGKKEQWKKTKGLSGGNNTSSKTQVYDYIIKPDFFRDRLHGHKCVIKHTNGRVKKRSILPLV